MSTPTKLGKGRTKSVDPNPDTLSNMRCFTDTHGIITTTMNSIPGYRVVKVLGTVYGLSVRSRNWGADIGSVLKSVVGGELGYLTNMLYQGRNQAIERLVGECMSRDGNAVIAMRFDSGEVMNFAQVCAYGTAVLVEKMENEDAKKEVQDDMIV